MIIDPATYLPPLIGILIGLFLGWVVWGRVARERRTLRDSLVVHERARADSAAEHDRLARELTATREQIRPLADEVDRLKRDAARRPAVLETVTAAPVAAGVAATTTALPADDIRLLKGVGDRFAAHLQGAGLRSVDAIARLNADEAEELDAGPGPFAGRIARDRLVEQAALISEGRIAEYEARFGKLGTA